MLEPKVLVSVKIDADLEKRMHEIMMNLGVSKDQFLRDAIRFYRTNCVHTQRARRSPYHSRKARV